MLFLPSKTQTGDFLSKPKTTEKQKYKTTHEGPKNHHYENPFVHASMSKLSTNTTNVQSSLPKIYKFFFLFFFLKFVSAKFFQKKLLKLFAGNS